MNKRTKHEPTPTDTPKPAPQTKRYDEAFKQQVVENWIKNGQPGTHSAEEFGGQLPLLA